MKKIILPAIVLILFLSGCSAKTAGENANSDWAKEWQTVHEDFENKNQKIEIYSAGEEPLVTITDNEEIFYFIKSLRYDKAEYNVSIPNDAVRICTIHYEEEGRNGQLQTSQDSVYYNGTSCYLLTDLGDRYDAAMLKLPEETGEYLMELTGLTLADGIASVDDEQRMLPEAEAETGEDRQVNLFAGMTIDDMVKVSAENEIELCDGNETLVDVLTENQDVYDFLQSLDTGRWIYKDDIPENAECIAEIRRFQLGRRAYKGQMTEQWRQYVYAADGYFYVDMLTLDPDGSNAYNEQYPERYQIPADIGEYLQQLVN